MVNAQDHPLFARISHYINLSCFVALGITGFMIHSPSEGLSLNVVRNIHFMFAYLLVFNGLVRIYYSLFGKYRDYKEFLPNSRDFKTLPGIIKYYLFMGKHPETGKYNPLQKAAYLALFLFAAIQCLTGLALYRPQVFGVVAGWFGGLEAARSIHYLITWLFVAIVLTHVYLVFSEAFEQFKYMFFGIADQKK